MAWIDISEESYKIIFTCRDTSQVANKNVWITLQYDDESVSPTSVRIRFKLSSKNNSNYYDQFFLLLKDGGGDSGEAAYKTFIKIKEDNTTYGGAKYPYYWPADKDSDGYKLTKSYSAAAFKLPAFYFINGGQDAAGYATEITTVKQAYYIATHSGAYSSTIEGTKVYGRSGYTLTVDSDELEVVSNTTVAANGTKPSISIVDRGNNTCLISGSLGKNGNNNPITSATLYYTTDGSDPAAGGLRQYIELIATSGGVYSKSIPITNTCTIRAMVECEFEYNTTSASSSKAVKFYTAPNKPGVPILSYKKNRLTVKEPWTFTWEAATAKNIDSPVAGYYIMLLRKAKGDSEFMYVTGLCDAGNNYISQIENAEPDDPYYLRRESTSCTAIIEDPATFDFSPDDKVKLRITAYTWNNYSPKQTLQSDIVDSAEYLIQNAGVMRVKVAGQWKEGQVWIKDNNVWHEAETVNIKTATGWKESE